MQAANPNMLFEWVVDMVAALGRHRSGIMAALEHAPGHTHNFDDIVEGVLTGRYRLWDWGDAFAITEVHIFPRERHYHLFLGGGRLDTLLAQHETLLQAARDLDCRHVTISGRMGWIRALRRVRPEWRLALATVALEVT